MESSVEDESTDNGTVTNPTKAHKKRPILICTSGTKYRLVSEVAREMGWRNTKESDTWNLNWTDCILGVECCKQMKRFQKMNHFPGMAEICRKDMLARNLNRMLKYFPNDYDIFPKTWCLPADLGDAEEYLRQHRNRTLILKPDHGSQGRGVVVTKTLKNYQINDRMICQVYIRKPLLIDGFKFDLRVYTLITSIDPLRIFVYNEGLARFATSPYREPNGHNLSNHYMHLTNYSVNKHSQAFVSDDEAGSKRTFESVQKLMLSEGYNVQKMWSDIDDVIIKTIISGWVSLKHNYKASFPNHDIMQACFEVLGIDILVDQNLKPYILEVNHSPSFYTYEQVDKDVKTRLIRDTLQLLNISGYDKKKIIEEDRQRVTKRLMKQIRIRSLKRTSDSTIQSDRSENSEVLKNQFNWEEENLGNYRLVLPDPSNTERYAKFLEFNTQYSPYAETAASKRREQVGKKYRLEIEKRGLSRVIQNTIRLVQAPLQDMKIDKKKTKLKKRRSPVDNGFLSNLIEQCDVTRLNTIWAERDIFVRKTGLLQFICHSHFQNNVMREEDQKRYRHLLALDVVQIDNNLGGDEKLTFVEG